MLCCAAQSLAEALNAPHALPLLDSPALDSPFPTPPAPLSQPIVPWALQGKLNM